MTDKSYPGELATPKEVCALADEYRKAAHLVLGKLGSAGKPLTYAPFRLAAIHAIELYLSALLLHRGYSAPQIRALNHDLAARCERASAAGLNLRKLTAAHLQTLSETREYLVTRYDPKLGRASQINRLTATLDEVAKKVAAALRCPTIQSAAARCG